MKNVRLFAAMITFSAVSQVAHAASLELVFCSQNFAVLDYETTSVEATPNIEIRDLDITTNSVIIDAGDGVGTVDGNFANEWSGSNTNIEALFVNASGAQVGAVSRCPE